MPKKQNTNAQRAREAARQGTKYTQALRDAAGDQPPADTTAGISEPDDGFGGHDFAYEQRTDLFRCTECRVHEVMARSTDGSIAPCTGLVGYGGEPERVYLLLTGNPAMPFSEAAFLATRIRDTGIGRTPQFSWRNGKLLVESDRPDRPDHGRRRRAAGTGRLLGQAPHRRGGSSDHRGELRGLRRRVRRGHVGARRRVAAAPAHACNRTASGSRAAPARLADVTGRSVAAQARSRLYRQIL